MGKLIGIALLIVGIGVTYQNCESGYPKNASTAKSLSPLGLQFSYIQQSFLTTANTISLEGKCSVNSYPDHRIDWEYTFNGTHYQGRTERPCSANGRFFLVLNVTSLTRAASSTFTVLATLAGIKSGLVTKGQVAQVKILFKTSGGTTGETTGGTGGTTGYGATFANACPDDVAAGTTEYCTNDANFETYCQSITYPPDASGMVQLVASERPELIRECGRNAAANPQWNAFTSEVLRRLRAESTSYAANWGFNGVRGVVSDINGDTISYWGGGGAPQEGEVGNVVMDVVMDCGGTSRPQWMVYGAYCACCTKMSRWTLGNL